MANPVLVNITPIATWQKVATAVTGGYFVNKETQDKLYYTYVETGNPAPTPFAIGRELAIDEGVELSNSVAVDFYFYAKNKVAVVEVQV